MAKVGDQDANLCANDGFSRSHPGSSQAGVSAWPLASPQATHRLENDVDTSTREAAAMKSRIFMSRGTASSLWRGARYRGSLDRTWRSGAALNAWHKNMPPEVHPSKIWLD